MLSLTVSNEDILRVKKMGFLLNKHTDNFSGRVLTTNGNITAEQQICIGNAARLFGNGTVCFTTRLTVEVPGIPYEKIEEFQQYVAQEGLTTGGTGAKIRPVVSCKGTTCQYGLIDTFAIAKEIHERFFIGYQDTALPHKFKIAVGGCPNNCVKPSLNDIGVVGHKNGYRIFIGGRWGRQYSIGQPLTRIAANEEELMLVIERLLGVYIKYGTPRKRFAQLVESMGVEAIEAIVFENL
ncbi:MAG: (4Fe-4S)-binding protein [Lachnospiraceae bacterium]